MLHNALSNPVPAISISQNINQPNQIQRMPIQRGMNIRPIMPMNRMPNNGMTSPQQVCTLKYFYNYVI